MENSSRGKPCLSAPHHGAQPLHIAREAKGAQNHPSRAGLATGGWRIPLRLCVVRLELCNLRTSLGLMRQPPCYPTVGQNQLAQHLLALVCTPEISSLSEYSLQPGFKGFICSFFFLRGFFSLLSCNEQSGNVLDEEPNLGNTASLEQTYLKNMENYWKFKCRHSSKVKGGRITSLSGELPNRGKALLLFCIQRVKTRREPRHLYLYCPKAYNTPIYWRF